MRGYSLGKEEAKGREEGVSSFFDLTPSALLLIFLSFFNLKMIPSLVLLWFMIHYNIITINKYNIK